MDTIAQLEKLGFTNKAKELKEIKKQERKMAIAYEHFRFVKQEKIDKFNAKIAPKGKYLAFTPINSYDKVPPTAVLEKLEKAQEIGCFDDFEVAHIADIKDPILFGTIKRCSDRFYIGEWDNDVSIDDILDKHEG